MFEYGDIIELIKGNSFYPEGTLAMFVCNDENENRCHIRYLREEYISGDVDIVPTDYFRKVEEEKHE